jgi:DNA-binding NtrC family response regulator
LADRIVIVDDERLTRETLVEHLIDEGFEAEAFSGAYEALERFSDAPADVVVTDLRMPSMNGTEFHARIGAEWPDTQVIFITAFGTVASAVEAMRAGAADYLTKPLNTDELVIRLRRILQHQREREEIQRLRAEVGGRDRFGELVFRSRGMRDVANRALTVAETDATVLIHGATGTGKEVLARAIHGHSARAAGPFIAVNAAGLNENLVESELFGHEVGAFTGASRLRKGRLEIAAGGTLLIDEVDDLSLEIQVRLLRFLQDRTFERVGSSKTQRSDVRVVCATKCDLADLVAEGRFREDLFYRINTVLIELPSLRERVEDIALLAEHFLGRAAPGMGGRPVPGALSQEALGALLSHDWPGNVRELQHVIEHAVAFGRGPEVELRDLPPQFEVVTKSSVLHLSLGDEDKISLSELLQSCEEQAIEWALSRSAGNQAQAADLLGVPRTTLRSRMEALRLNGDSDAAP